MRGIDSKRGEHREDPLGEQLVHPILLGRCELIPAKDLDAFLGQCRPDVVLEDLCLLRDQLAGAIEDR